MDSKMFKSGISVESVAMFAVSTFLFIFLVPCLYFAHRVICNVCCFYKVRITPDHSEVEQYSTSSSSNDTENKPNHEIKTRSTLLTSGLSRSLNVIIGHQEEEIFSIA
jgi:hypothetical protein